MRNLLIALAAFFVLATDGKLTAQPLTNDTVVCIIDTTKSYVSYRAYPFAQKDSSRWQIAIKGHYYDYDSPEYPYSQHKDFACIVLEAYDFRNIRYESGPGPKEPKLKVAKTDLGKRYITVTEEWINGQTDLYKALMPKLGYIPADKYNFVIFKQDYDNTGNDSVIMHRVRIGYSEVAY